MDLDKFINNIENKFISELNKSYNELQISGSIKSGKFLRSKLVWYLTDKHKNNLPMILELSAILELIHYASLVLDDIIDSSEIRRYQPAVWKKDGISKALLLGNTIYTNALNMLTSEYIPEYYLIRFIKKITDLVAGEVSQEIKFKHKRIDKEVYYNIIRKKTGTLFSLAGLIASSNENKNDEIFYENLGYDIGTVYQLYDDLLDIDGDENISGKNLRIDASNGKLTLPVINGVQYTKNEISVHYNKIMHALNHKLNLQESVKDFFRTEISGVYKITSEYAL